MRFDPDDGTPAIRSCQSRAGQQLRQFPLRSSRHPRLAWDSATAVRERRRSPEGRPAEDGLLL